MTLTKITLSSFRRQKRKKAFLITAVFLSFAAVLTLNTFINSQTYRIENQFDEYGANIIITPKTDTLSLSYGGIDFNEVVSVEEIMRDDLKAVKTINDYKSIRAVAPKLIGAVTLTAADKKESVVIVGTDFSEEFKIKGWWNNTPEAPLTDKDVIIGFDVARVMGINAGDTVNIDGKEFHVSQVLPAAGNQDDRAVIASLTTVEKMLNKEGKISLVEISALCSECPIEELVRQLQEVLPNANVRALQEVMGKRMAIVAQMEKFALSVTVILILLSSLLIFSTIASSVNERKHEIGIYRAIGFTKSHIFQIIQGESLILSVLSGILGILTAIVAGFLLLPPLTGVSPEDVIINTVFFSRAFILLILLGFLSSLPPAINASQTDPVKTINSY